jgi:hypothetical protein
MSRIFRFIRRDDGAQAEVDVSLRCAHAADALLVAASLGGSVEVWDGARRIGVVGGEPAGPPPTEAAPPAQAPSDIGRPEPLASEPEVDDPDRPFNPFRPGAWRRLRRE